MNGLNTTMNFYVDLMVAEGKTDLNENSTCEELIAYDKTDPHEPWGQYADELYGSLKVAF